MTTPSTTYVYHAVNRAGRRERGTTEAESALALSRTLEARGLIVLDVEARSAVVARRPARRSGRGDVAELTRSLAALLQAGVPLSRALSTVTTITPGALTPVIDDLRGRIARGESLGAAIASHPRVFTALYAGVVRAGERSGNLSGSFAALAAQLDREERLRARLLAASIYPLILAVASAAAIAVLVLYVLPSFAELLEGARATIPRSTATLLAMAEGVRGSWPILLGVVVSVGAALGLGARTESGRRSLASLLLKTPLVGALRRYTLAARLGRVLSVLLAGGAPLLSALEDTQQSLADPVARDAVGRIRARVRDGTALNVAIGETGLFPPLLPRLVAIGEESSRLEEFLGRAADICEDKAERLLQRVVALAEPAMIMVLGVMVAFIALSLLQAIYGVDASAFR